MGSRAWLEHYALVNLDGLGCLGVRYGEVCNIEGVGEVGAGK